MLYGGAKHLCKECDQIGNFLTSKDCLKTLETLNCRSECAVLTGMKDDNCISDTDPDMHVNLGKQELGMIPQNDLLNRGVFETVTAVSINDWAKRELSKLEELPTFHIPVEAPPGSVLLQAADPTDVIKKLHSIETNHLVPFTLEPNDAVVPGSDSNPEDDTLLERHEDQSTAHLLFDHVPVGFDTFEKIQLSPLDTSSPSQAFQTESHRADGTGPSGESDNKDISEEMEKCQEEPKKALLHCGKYRFNEDTVPDSLSHQISTPLASLEKPGQTLGTSQFDSLPQSKLPSITSITNIERVCEIHSFPEFEMKKRFDMVIEELGLYFEIRDEPSSRSPERATSVHCHLMVPGAEEDSALIIQSGSDQPSSRNAVEGEPYRGTSLRADDHRVKTYRAKPEKRRTTVGLECEQEVPLECSHPSTEGDESMYSSVKGKDSREQGADDRSNMWSPAFRFLPCLNQLNQRQPEQQQNKRLEPLRTCNRPIRVGLSRKLKTKHLHPFSK
ncbi:hypothetical protein UPYG_G00255050 [Umbra pygmaea]|uniref:RAD51 interacting motif domain-containing protein n=1 Tax=Umbra pygmaea TaxID=75934 RepID=A0ABD0WCT2_UMBPY